MTERVHLTDVAILADPDEPSFVVHGVHELQSYPAALTGKTPVLLERWDDGLSSRQMTIAIGRDVLQRLGQQSIAVPEISTEHLGPEGFIVRSTT